ncbi:hypothetical protein VNI00_006448 [Paramarasmius palmivorus]|uniref:SET domain-containing protein n=1 Tax=Paramarasmius palmivorus TaxID=297713 RepID=A0AAW0D8Y6_9AGAR
MPSTSTASRSRSNSRTSRRRRSSAGLTLPLQQIKLNGISTSQRSPTRVKTPHKVSFASPIQDVHAIPESPGGPRINYIRFDDSAYTTTFFDFPVPVVNAGAPKHPPFYQITHSSNGLGMITTQDIPRGGVILVERPVLVALTSALGCLKLDLLDPKLQKAVMSLTSPNGTFEEIMRTNSFQVQVTTQDKEEKKCFGLFMDMARVNHSCGPNALWHWNPATFTLTLEAVRPIAANNEITIPYIDCLQPRSARRHQLQITYGFECRCSFCDIHWSSPSSMLYSSDSARLELSQFWDKLPLFEAWCKDRAAGDEDLVKMHIRALELREKEGVQGFCYKKHIDAIAMCYGALEDVEGFRVWTDRARKLRIANGDFASLKVMERWLEDPRSFPAWGMRRNGVKD